MERLKAVEHSDCPSPAATDGGAVPTTVAAGRSRGLIHWFSIGFACAWLYRRALEMHEKALPAGHPYIATILNNLAVLYQVQGRLAEAEPLYKRSLEMREKALPAGHPYIATSLNNLAVLYRAQGRLAEAEQLFKRSLEMREKALPGGHSDIADSLIFASSAVA